LRAVLFVGLCAAVVAALWAVATRGYPGLGAVLAPLAILQLWTVHRDAACGALLCWDQGLWTLEHGGVRRVIEPGRRSTATRWVIYLPFTEQTTGRAGRLWLYADSSPPEPLRQLRVRLTLLG